MSAALQPLLALADVAKLLGCSDDTVLRIVHRGELRALKRPQSRAFRFRQADVEAYLGQIEFTPAKPLRMKRGTTEFARRLRAIGASVR